jgi:hypothetical protein
MARAGSITLRILLFLAKRVVRGPIIDLLALAIVFSFKASS